jgi:hypothetical protein
MGAVEGGHPAWYNTQTRQLSIEPNVKMAEKGQLMKDLDTGENKIFLPRSKTTIPLGQKAALDLPTDRPLTYNEQIRKDYYDLNRAQKDKVMDFRDQVTKDKLVAEARDSLMSVDMALSLIDANIPGSGGAIKRGLLKMFESGGRFTNEDVQQFGGEQSALARLTRMAILETQGKDLSPDDQKYAKQLALVIQRKTQDKLKEATNRYTEDLVRIGVPEQTAGRAILGGLIDTPTLWIDPKTKRKVAVSNAQSAAALSKGLLPPWHAEEANLQTELTKYEEAAAKAAKGK